MENLPNRTDAVARLWYGRQARAMVTGMNDDNGRVSRAGGFILAVTIMAGALIGGRLGQASAGFLIGTAVGVAVALGLYIYDRRH